jgi:hypothetical protein
MNKKDELLMYKEILEFIKQYIEQNCIYDEHLQGYLFGLTPGHIRTMMYTIQTMENKDEKHNTK